MKTKTMKITGILLSVVMFVAMVGAFSLTVSAATETVGAFSVDTDVTNGYTYSGGVLTISESGAYRISMAASEGPTSDRIVIKATGVTLTLDSVNIKAPNDESALTVEQNTSLILVGESTLIGGDAYIMIPDLGSQTIPKAPENGINGGNNQITISGDGTLTAIAGENYINDYYYGYAVKDCTVILHGGTLKVKGGTMPKDRDQLYPATRNVAIRAADGKILEITDTKKYSGYDSLSQATYTAVPCTICTGNNDDELTYTYTVLETGHVARYACCNRLVVSEEPVAHDYNNAEHTCVCGVLLPHSYVYAANEEENTITETCAHGCSHNRLITLKAPENLVYNGTVKEATVEGTIIGTYEITYDSAPVNVGTYTASITVGDATVSVDFTIEKAALTVKANNYTISYGDEPTNNGVTYTGFVNGENENVLTGELTYSYTYVQNGDVGDYTITPAGLTSDNYEINFESGTLTVAKKLIDSVEGLVVTLNQESFVYDGAEKKPNVTSITLNDQLIDAAYYDVFYNNNVYVGDNAEVIITFKGNYDGEITQVFKITSKPILDSDISIDITEATYNGNAYTPTITVKDGEKTLVLDTDYTIVWDKDGFVNAGTYTATIKGKGNYGGSFTRTLVINKADLVIELTSPIPSVLPGNQIALNLKTNSNEGTPVWTVTGATHVSGTTIKVADSLVIGLDTVTVKVSYLATTNYKAGYMTIELEVGMADFSETIANLEADIDELNELIADKADADDIEQKLTEITNRVEALEDVKDAYIAADATLKSELEEKLSAAKNELTDSINGLNDRITEEVGKLQDQITSNDTDIDGINVSITTINGLIDALKAADETLGGQLSDAVEKAENELATAVSDLEDRIAEEVEKLQNQINANDADIDGINASITTINGLIDALKKADEALGGDISEAVTKAENELKAVQDELKELIGDVQTNLDNAKAELDKAIADLDAAMKQGDADLSKEIANLNTALEEAKAALEATDAANKSELEGKITEAQATLQSAIDKVAKDLADAEKELADAIASGDTALDNKITALNAALNSAISAYQTADTALKSELTKKIEAADATLDAAIKAVQKKLDDAKAELDKAIADGDTALDGKITALNEALATAKAALEAVDTASKSELTTKIDEAYASLDAAIKVVQKNLDDLKASLEAKDVELTEKTDELQTFIIIVCVISGVTLCGSGAFIVWFFIDRKKRI